MACSEFIWWLGPFTLETCKAQPFVSGKKLFQLEEGSQILQNLSSLYPE